MLENKKFNIKSLLKYGLIVAFIFLSLSVLVLLCLWNCGGGLVCVVCFLPLGGTYFLINGIKYAIPSLQLSGFLWSPIFLFVIHPVIGFAIGSILFLIKKSWKVSIILIMIIFAVGQISHTVFIKQIAEQKVGWKQYDFSQPILLNDKLSGEPPIQMKSNKIVWINQVEWDAQTKEYLCSLFLFEFYPEESSGLTTKITDFNIPLSKGFWGRVILLNNQIYWIQDSSLFHYDSVSKKSELLLENVSDIFGGGSDYIILKDIDLFIYNLFTGEKINIGYLDINKEEKIIISGSDVIYVSTTISDLPGLQRKKEIRRFNIISKKDEMLLKVDIPRQYEPRILLDYNDDYIAYGRNNYDGKAKEIIVYKISTSEKVLIKPQGYYYAEGSKDSTYYPKIYVGKIVGNYFYYGFRCYGLPGSQISRTDLSSGEEKTIVTTGNLSFLGSGRWDTDGRYIVYMKDARIPGFYIYLQVIK